MAQKCNSQKHNKRPSGNRNCSFQSKSFKDADYAPSFVTDQFEENVTSDCALQPASFKQVTQPPQTAPFSIQTVQTHVALLNLVSAQQPDDTPTQPVPTEHPDDTPPQPVPTEQPDDTPTQPVPTEQPDATPERTWIRSFICTGKWSLFSNCFLHQSFNGKPWCHHQ